MPLPPRLQGAHHSSQLPVEHPAIPPVLELVLELTMLFVPDEEVLELVCTSAVQLAPE